MISFEAKDGELHLLTKTNCWVTTKTEMGDFEVELEVKLPPRRASTPGSPSAAPGPRQAQGIPVRDRQRLAGPVCTASAPAVGFIPARPTRRSSRRRSKACSSPTSGTISKCVPGPRIQTWLNGKAVADIEHKQILKGYFGIQHHGKGGTVKFRNIRARELPGGEKGDKGPKGRPNILWITAEDMSPTLGCYGDKYATSPNIDKLATRSTRYDNAFAVSPVVLAVALGVDHRHPQRHHRHPPDALGFPAADRCEGFPVVSCARAGYFTTNNVKTDYNTSDAERLIAESWDESSAKAHWRSPKRKDGQPFFSVFNLMTSHQSRTMVWPHKVFEKHVQSETLARRDSRPEGRAAAEVLPGHTGDPQDRGAIL